MVAEPKLRTVSEPPPEPPKETTPKRDGRSMTNDERIAAGMKPRGRRSGSTARSTSLETQIGAMLVSLNFVAMVIPPISQDALDDAEIAALAIAIDAQCKTSPRFRKYVEAAVSAGSGGQLITVVGMIVARRASRHGILPENLDPAIGTMLASQTGTKPRTPFNQDIPTETVPTMLNEDG